MTKQLPLVVVLGATACGKSKLAIELARKFNGEIISADSMQVYRGLDIVTNKVTKDEQQQAKHHMINLVDPTSRYSVIDFRNKSLQIIDDLLNNRKLPVVVGGTHYYIESLIWQRFTHGVTDNIKKRESDFGNNSPETDISHQTLFDLESQLVKDADQSILHSEDDLESVDKFFSKPILSLGLKHLPVQKLWNILELVDPKTAHVFHPNDRRRVIRSLQLIQQNRKQYSELMDDANRIPGDKNESSLGGPVRFPKTCVFWLNSEEETLNKILDERVDQMLDRGLLAELEDFHEEFNKERIKNEQRALDYDKGIFQTIGFKEFHEYLMMSTDQRCTEEGKKILAESIADMKCSTRRYAKTQLRWIRRRFLRSGTRNLPQIFKLNVDFSDEGWLEDVHKPAIEILDCIINDKELDKNIRMYQAEPEQQELGKFEPGKYYCDICDRTIIGKIPIEQHLKSRNHYRRVSSQKRKKARLEEQEQQKQQQTTVAPDGDTSDQEISHSSEPKNDQRLEANETQ